MTMMRPLREVLEPADCSVAVDPTLNYPMIGVRSFGKGAFASADLQGSQTRYTTLRKVRQGMVIYPKLMAWEGAFAVVPPKLDGHHASPEFVAFDVGPEASDRYLSHLVSWDGFRDALATSSTGTNARRRRLQAADFLAHRVPLPHIDEQRRIAAHLDAVESRVVAMSRETRKPALVHAIQRAVTDRLIESGPLAPLSALADVNPAPRQVASDDTVGFVPMAAVSDRTGQISTLETRTKAQLTSGYKQFISGDVIFARITPCMQNGKSAIYRSADYPTAYGSTEFHVIRADDPQVSTWLHHVLRSQWLLDQAIHAFTGTAGQQRVPATFLRSVMVPAPRDFARASAQVAELERLQIDGLAMLERSESLRASLLPAARNEVFSALR